MRNTCQNNLTDDVKNAIQSCLKEQDCRLEQVAHKLGIDPRSLQRHLRKTDLSFSDLVTKSRMEIAFRHLGKPELPISEVSKAAGYSDSANFGRAFRDWTGLGPRDWRDRALQSGLKHR